MGVRVDERDDAGIGEAEETSEYWPDDRDEQRTAQARQEHLRTAGGTSQPQGLLEYQTVDQCSASKTSPAP